MDQARINVANAVLKTFAPRCEFFTEDGSQLFLRTFHGSEVRISQVRIRKSHDWFQKRNVWPYGGTSEQAAVQLINYIRDYPRLPIETWEYWAGHSIRLGSAETVRLLRESDYSGPKTRCVLCKSTTFSGGLDWWDHGPIGPCCWNGNCREKDQAADSHQRPVETSF